MVPFCIEDQVLTPGAVFFGDPALSFWVDALLRTSGASLGRLDVTSCQDLCGDAFCCTGPCVQDLSLFRLFRSHKI